jgi:hypothetical protein
VHWKDSVRELLDRRWVQADIPSFRSLLDELIRIREGDHHRVQRFKSHQRENIMSRFYKKAALICAAAATGALLSAMPVSVESSATSGIVLSVDQAQARVGHPGSAVSVAGVNRRHRRAARRCATGVTC